MELLILFALAVWGHARYSANGIVAHARKTEPLRIAERRQRAAQAHERAMARMARRRGPGIADAISMRIAARVATPRGGPARDAITLWWSDSWGYATERRLLRHERAAAGQLGRQKAAQAVTGWLTQVAGRWRAQRATSATRRAGEREWVWGDADVVADEPDIVDAEVVDEPDTPTPTAGHEPGADAEPEPPGDQTSDTDPTPTPPPRAERASTPQHQPDDTDPGLASVHPIRKDPDMTTTSPISTSTGGAGEQTVSSAETLDPAAGLSFVTGVGGVAARLVSEIELSLSSLRQRGVSGEPVDLLVRMQEAAHLLASNSTCAASHFERHLATQDVVLSDPSLAGTVENTYIGTRS